MFTWYTVTFHCFVISNCYTLGFLSLMACRIKCVVNMKIEVRAPSQKLCTQGTSFSAHAAIDLVEQYFYTPLYERFD